MLTGVKFRAHPNSEQRQTLSRWIGVSRVVWNLKCAENKSQRAAAKSEVMVDQKYSHLRDDSRPWMAEVPSHIYRNTTVKWYNTYWKFKKGECGRPHKHKKSSREGVQLTSELFQFVKGQDGKLRLMLGNKKFPIGELEFHAHRKFQIPRSIVVSRSNGKWYVSFCYDDGVPEQDLLTKSQYLDSLRKLSREELGKIAVGIDRGIAVPVQAGEDRFLYSATAKKRQIRYDIKKKRYQRQMARREKGSKRRNKAKYGAARMSERQGNIRNDFAHKTTRKLVDSEHQVFVMEHLRVKNMSKGVKPKKDEKTGKYLPNGKAAKSGLNKAILNIGWGRIETLLDYKSRRAGKVMLKVDPAYSSQECAACGHTHPDNRKTQANFACLSCGHTDNADRNAAAVIKKRAIKLILHPGAGLSDKGVLTPPESGTGRGGRIKSSAAANADVGATSREPSKKKVAKATRSPRLKPRVVHIAKCRAWIY